MARLYTHTHTPAHSECKENSIEWLSQVDSLVRLALCSADVAA